MALRKAKPTAEALYEAKSSYSVAGTVYRAGTRLRGDHEEVRARFGRWMSVDLPDDEKGRLRAEADWGQVVAEGDQHGPAPEPIAVPPSGPFQAIRSFRLADADLQHIARINAGQLVDASDEVFKRYPHLFAKPTEVR